MTYARFEELRSRPTLAALALLVPTAVFWITLILGELFAIRAPFEALFVPLDRDLAGRLTLAVLMFAMPSIAALCVTADFVLRIRRREPVYLLHLAILALCGLSMAAIFYHALADR
jgi:hypothetical protein